jgi:hypothetical protein
MGQAFPTTSHPTETVCIANLPAAASEADIRTLFSQYGAVQEVRLFSGEPYRRSEGSAYLDLRSDAVESAVKGLDGQVFNGSIIRVSHVSGSPPTRQVPKDRPTGHTPRTDDETPSSLLRRRYEVASVEKAAMPDGGEGGDWYRYVLLSGRARITGLHRGTLEEVTAYATACTEDFNMRSATGRSTRAMAYKKK